MDKSEETPKWETLDRDILCVIFNKLDVMDLIMGASRVCSYWFVVSHDKTLWETVDLSKLQQVVVSYSPWVGDKKRPVVFYNHRVDDEDDKVEKRLSFRDVLVKMIKFYLCRQSEVEKGMSLRKVLTEITKLSGTTPNNLLFHYHSYISEDDLMFAAERMPNINKLVLPRWCYLNAKSFMFAFNRWKNLTTLIIAHDFNINRGFVFPAAMGIKCTNLTNFKYLGCLDEYDAKSIVRCFKKLKRLSLRCSFVSIRGVSALIRGLQNLAVFNLTHCVFQDSDLVLQFLPSVIGTVLRDDLVQAATKKLEKLIKCSNGCRICNGLVERLALAYKDDTYCWDAYEKYWGTDEIEEFVF